MFEIALSEIERHRLGQVLDAIEERICKKYSLCPHGGAIAEHLRHGSDWVVVRLKYWRKPNGEVLCIDYRFPRVYLNLADKFDVKKILKEAKEI